MFGNAKRSSDSCFTVLYAASAAGQPRLGLAIAKKSVPRAVDRNRIKRIIREHFRLNSRELPALDLVIMARRDTATSPNTRLRQSLARHWQKVSS